MLMLNESLDPGVVGNACLTGGTDGYSIGT